jgi:hypothetical protein
MDGSGPEPKTSLSSNLNPIVAKLFQEILFGSFNGYIKNAFYGCPQDFTIGGIFSLYLKFILDPWIRGVEGSFGQFFYKNRVKNQNEIVKLNPRDLPKRIRSIQRRGNSPALFWLPNND